MNAAATKNRFVALWLVLCMALSFSGFSVSAVTEDEDIKTNGTISFEGFAFKYMEDDTIQAKADVYIEKLRMTDMIVALEYKNYIVPSELDTNLPTADVEKMFKVDAQLEKYLRPLRTNIDTDSKTIYLLLSLDQDLLAEDYKDKTVSATDVITNRAYSVPETIIDWHINAYNSSQTKIKIGTMSFRVTDPAQLIEVKAEDIESRVIKTLKEEDGTTDVTAARFVTASGKYDDLIMNSKVVIDIDAERTEAAPTVPRKTVSAYTLYKTCSDASKAGTVQALLDYINKNMSRVKVKRATGQQSIEELANWTLSSTDPAYNAVIKYVEGSVPMYEESFDTAKTLDTANVYDASLFPDGYRPKGDVTYMITQPYMHNTDQLITIYLTVTPSELMGFTYDRRVRVFTESDRTLDWDKMNMPDPITPIVTGVDDEYIPPAAHPAAPEDWSYTPDGVSKQNADNGLTKLNTDTVTVKAEFLTEYSRRTELENEPWLTIADGFNWNVDAYRYVVSDSVDPPKPPDDTNTDIQAEIIFDNDVDVDIPGKLKITVNRLGGKTIDAGAKFNIYLPNGWVLTDDESYVDVTISGGTAEIIVDAMTLAKEAATDKFNMEQRRTIQSLINLGSSKDFRLSELLPPDNLVESPLYPFSFDKRYNRYLDDDTYFEYYVKDEHTLIAPDTVMLNEDPKTSNYILKDYSGGRSGLFKVYKGQSLKDIASYIDFPDDSTIPVMYHGKNGFQPAELGVAKVAKDSDGIAWRILGNPGATDIPTDTTGAITLVGTLQPYTYTDFGFVNNPQGVQLYLKVTPLDQPEPSESPTPDPGASPEPTIDPSASPSPEPTLDPNASPTPVPGEAIEISTKVPPPGVYKVVLNDKTFQYDKKNEGYTEAQHQVFTIKNIGSVDIPGLTLRIEDVTETGYNGNADNFVNSVPLDITKLDKDKTLNKLYSTDYNEIDVEIRPKVSLPEGKYKARVIVGSRNNDDLAHFDIEFIVVNKNTKLYKLTIDNYKDGSTTDLSEIGIAYLTDSGGLAVYSNYFEAGETVPLQAVVLDTDGYVFDHWLKWDTGQSLGDRDTYTGIGDGVDWLDTDNVQDNPKTFLMPEYDTTVKPIFSETVNLWLRLAHLEDYTILDDTDRTKDRENDLRDKPNHIIETTPQYDENTHTYYVIVDEKEEDNYLKFGIKQHDTYKPINYTVTLRYADDDTKTEHDIKDAADTGTPNADNTVNTYKTQDFKLHEGYNYVTITTTYVDTATSKTYTQKYTVIIHRRKTNVDVTWRPGNSPYGLIEGSDTFADDTARTAAKTEFSRNHSFIAFKDEIQPDTSVKQVYTNEFTPSEAVNTFNTYYSEEAWKDTKSTPAPTASPATSAAKAVNYDESVEALFVYNKTTFVDPGFTSLKNDDGSAVDPKDVSREIQNLIVLKPGYTPTADELMEFGDLTTLDSAKLEKKATVAIDNTREKADGSCVIDELSTLNVLPGVYKLVYKFKDNTGITVSFDRPLIILPEKGDINVDGASDTTDADILYQRHNNLNVGFEEDGVTPLPYKSFCTEVIDGSEPWERLLSYRVGDVNEDRNVNSIDANADYKNVALTAFKRYYEPLPTAKTTDDKWPGMARVADRDADITYTDPDPIPTDKPVLVLDFLGTASSPANKVPSSPKLTVYNGTNPRSGMAWFGVGIKNPEKLDYFIKNGLYSVDFAIDYDPDIMEPCDLNGRIATDAGFDLAATITTFNLDPIIKPVTIDNSDVGYWKDAELYTPSLQTDLDLDTEDFGSVTKVNRYKTEFITLRAKADDALRIKGLSGITNQGVTSTDFETIYLLRVPFRLKQIPEDGKYIGYPVTIEAITEQTFVMGGTENGASEGASWEGEHDKTTADTRSEKLLNAYNHFDGIEVVNLFNSTTFTLKGVVTGWNPIQPFEIKLFRSDKYYEDGDPPEMIFKSIGSDDYYTNGETTIQSPNGEVSWAYELTKIPAADYRVQIEKQSHMTYPYMEIKAADIDESTGILTAPQTIDMLVGDINLDGFIKDPDRAYLIHMFNKSRPWSEELQSRFDKNDLNGDRRINLFDLNLFNKHREKTYPVPTATPAPTTGP